MRKFLEHLAQKIAYRVGVEPGNFIGICLAILSGFALMINGAIGKSLGGEMHPFLITFFRSAIIVAILLPSFLIGGYQRIKPTRHRYQFFNGLVFTGAVVGWFWCLPRVPLDMVAAIGFTSQLYAILGAIMFLGEKAKGWRWVMLLVGFFGAMIIVRPGFVEISPGVFVLIVTAILFSTNRLIIKWLSRKDNPEATVVWMSFWATIFTIPLAFIYWQVPTLTQSFLLISIALVTIISHYTMTWALKLGDIGAIEPTTFMRLIWGAIIGFFIFNDLPDVFTICGGLVVFISIIYTARRERKEGRKEEMVN
ncbi:MAG: DMT family transporter [Pseudomonadota bacterium]|nr:DMT family transporter [Pseudomonadota bacterium]